MDADTVLKLIKTERLEKLASIYQVDKRNTKIIGALVFKSLLRSILLNRGTSLRSLQMLIESSEDLKSLLHTNNESKKTLCYSTISKRLSSMPLEYFQAIYQDLVEDHDGWMAPKQKVNLHRFDSTIMTLVGHAVKDGLNLGSYHKNNTPNCQVKITAGLKNTMPTSVRFCTKQEEASEDIALVRAINEAKIESEDILLFDRGISNSHTFSDFTQRSYRFVTRLKVGRKIHIISENTVSGDLIKKDCIVNLFGKKEKQISTSLRLIILQQPTGQEIWFLTNIQDSSASEIAEMYKRRWDIEVFFKFLKQHLQLKHFISYSLHGMTIYIYMVLIAALLFLIYRTSNNLSGFKIPLLKFVLQLEQSIAFDLLTCSSIPREQRRGQT